jgi:sugar phosphate permease
MRSRVRGVFYGWWLVAITGFIMVITMVPLFHAMSVWTVALEGSFGWNRTQLGFALTVGRVEGGLMGPVEGYLTDRMGARRMVLTGLLILGAGFLIFSQVRSLWMFYAAFLVMSVGGGLGGWVPVMTVLNHWFVRRRATAMGWSNVGGRLGALMLVPAIAWAVDPEHNRLGWQATAMILGFFALLVAFPLTRLIHNRPAEYGLQPDGDPPAAYGVAVVSREPPGAGARQDRPAVTDMTTRQALRTPAFWLIAFGHGFSSMVILAIMAHLGLFMKDKGFDVQTTGWVVAAYTAVSMVFQLVGGFVGDRVPLRVALAFFTFIQAGAVLLLTVSSSIAMLYLFAMVFGMGFGGRNPLTTAIRGEYFGRASYGKILGMSTVPMNVLLLVAPPLAGLMRDVQGTYTQAFLTLAALNFLGGILFLFARKPVIGAGSR